MMVLKWSLGMWANQGVAGRRRRRRIREGAVLS